MGLCGQIGLFASVQTCTSVIADVGLSRSAVAAGVYSGARGQMFPSSSQKSPAGCGIAPTGTVVLLHGVFCRVGLLVKLNVEKLQTNRV